MLTKSEQEKIIVAGSLLCAGYYWWHCETNTIASIIAKVSSTALITHLGRDTQLASSLFLHCLGDLLIKLPGAILPALATFFAGHAFCANVLRKNRVALRDIHWLPKITMPFFLAYGICFTHQLVQNTHNPIKQIAIPLYFGALFMMLIFACMQKQRQLHIFVSAFLYALSDNLIGYNLFLQKTPGIGYITWPLYYGGQLSMLFAHKKTHVINELQRVAEVDESQLTQTPLIK